MIFKKLLIVDSLLVLTINPYPANNPGSYTICRYAEKI